MDEADPANDSQEMKCPHDNKYKVARNMCYTCYHARDKLKKATSCPHTDKPVYSNGMCQICYLKTYYESNKEQIQEKRRVRRAQRRQKQLDALADNLAPKDEQGPDDIAENI